MFWHDVKINQKLFKNGTMGKETGIETRCRYICLHWNPGNTLCNKKYNYCQNKKLSIS